MSEAIHGAHNERATDVSNFEEQKLKVYAKAIVFLQHALSA